MMKVIFVVFLTAVFAESRTLLPPQATLAECSNIQQAERFDCHPEDGANPENCEQRGCCWLKEKLPAPGLPSCFYPKNFGGYEFINQTNTDTGLVVLLQRTFQSSYPRDVQIVRVDVEFQTNERLRVKISDAENARFEAPYPKVQRGKLNRAADDPQYKVTIDTNQFGFQVARKDGTPLFDTRDLGAFIFADQFLQISAAINAEEIYGIGEQRTNLALSTEWTRYTLFNAGQPPRNDINLYGSHPFYMVVEPSSGRSHGVFLHNSNAMDILLQPLPAITYKTIGGILDFYFFLGPTPGDVVSQYTELIGRPFLPPYWSLGYHLCRYGYKSADETRTVWQRNRDAEIPFDVQWNDIDYMRERNDFTVDPINYSNLPELVKDVHDAGMHYVVIVDPGVSASEPSGTYPPYDDGVDMDVLTKDKNGDIYIGKVWNPVSTAFPDFFHPRATEYWTKQLREFRETIEWDAIWIDMNEPSNFFDGTADGCPDDELENPPYLPNVVGGKLYAQTLCMTAKFYSGWHYDNHNLYATAEADVTQQAITDILQKRSFVLSRATFVGSGAYTGHWSGDIFSTWDDLAFSIPGILQYSIFGMPFSGADICGFNYDTNPSLCNRWSQLGAFYPFSRNHNEIGQIDQDPAVFDKDVVDSIRKSLNIRYTLLPYLYTLLYKATVSGETVFRPLFFEFPQDKNTLKIDKSFLWGPALYIIPVLEEGAISVTAYFPPSRWYDLYTGEEKFNNGGEYKLEAPLDTIPLFIRGGYVVPTQAPAVTTTLSRKNGFTFVVALDDANAAVGELFWDDGESLDAVTNNKHGLLEFNAFVNKFTSKVVRWETSDTPTLEEIILLGVSTNVNEVILNGESVSFVVGNHNVIHVKGLQIPLNTDIEVTWS